MIVTPDMPREEGSTVAESGALLELADVIDDDGTGTKVALSDVFRPLVKLTVDSMAYPSESTYLSAADAIHLAVRLLEQASTVLVNAGTPADELAEYDTFMSLAIKAAGTVAQTRAAREQSDASEPTTTAKAAGAE